MLKINNYEYLLKDLTKLKGIGLKTAKILKKKKINTIFDLLWSLPQSYIDRTTTSKINELKLGSIHTIKVKVIKYNFPRIRNLPSKVYCEDDTGKLDCVFFNSYEGYIRKILPLNQFVTISGKINFYNNKYQITNPKYISTDSNIIQKKHNKYKLTEGITEKKYNKMINQLLLDLPLLEEWHDNELLKNFNHISWNESVKKLHNPSNINNFNSDFYRRLVFDEILASFLISSEIRKKIKKIKKKSKVFTGINENIIKKGLNFNLTNDQDRALKEVNKDLKSKSKMFRLIQGDVGSGKTIVALMSSLNVIESGYQVAVLTPTEILSRQHYNLAKKIFPKKIKIDLLFGNMKKKDKESINKKIANNEIEIIFGTHAIFQKKIKFNNLGYIIIDEQHKFGVNQRKSLSDKGGDNCDVLLMSATPIPRSLMMSVYGDMDVSLIKEKPLNRKPIITYGKFDNKTEEVVKFVKNEIFNDNQIFWVCPLIEDSEKVDNISTLKRYDYLNKIFPNKVGLIHGKIDQQSKEKILNDFLNKKLKILVTTTVIEVGIDFPNANVIIIENANKFGLSQLHQLRGRVGRGKKQSTCILMFKPNLSDNAKKRIKILKKTNDGFNISEEDMKMRGFGDILGFKQSGIKNFKLADPIQNQDLFILGEKEIKRIENEKININKYKPLLKLYDRADIINDIA